MKFVDIRSDGSEKVTYDYDGYWAYIRRGLLSHYPNYAANSHWHDDLEFIYVLSGSMDYNINGQIIPISRGNGIIVNSKQLHFGFSPEKRECEFICILLHPMLLCATQQIDRDFVSPVLSDGAMPYIFLDCKVAWQKEILDAIKFMCDSKDKPAAPLYVQQAFYQIWARLMENTAKEAGCNKQDRNLAVLKQMLSFIQRNYAEKVALEDIARSGNVSKSTCLTIFKKYLQDTPTNHLIAYRLKKSLELLKDTDLTVTEIALEVGFGGVSYFAETFRKYYGHSPSDYRRGIK